MISRALALVVVLPNQGTCQAPLSGQKLEPGCRTSSLLFAPHEYRVMTGRDKGIQEPCIRAWLATARREEDDDGALGPGATDGWAMLVEFDWLPDLTKIVAHVPALASFISGTRRDRCGCEPLVFCGDTG